VCAADVQITDYTNSDIVTLTTGLAKVQTGIFRVIHIIDIKEYENTNDKINQTALMKLKTYDPILPFIKEEVRISKNLINSLKVRNIKKRHIDLIGSAWKWLAGSPDSRDFEIIQEKINSALTNNNNQVILNRLINEKINKITLANRNLINSLKYEGDAQRDTSTTLMFQIQMLEEVILNLNQAIQWAKADISNPQILGDEEINEVKRVLDQNQLPYTNFEEAMHIAEVNIASNGPMLIYIVKIPVTDTKLCEEILIKPIKIGKYVNKIETENVIRCKDKIFAKSTKCNTYNKITICKH